MKILMVCCQEEEEEEEEPALKPSPDAETVILFTKPTGTGSG